MPRQPFSKPTGKPADNGPAGDDGDGTEGTTQLQMYVPATQFSDVAEFEAGETAFPLLRLGQGLTKEVAAGTANVGDWIMTGYDPIEAVTLIPTAIARTRVRRNPRNNAEVLCQSPDAVKGYGDPGTDCAGCPFSEWSEDAKGNRYPPECALTWNYLAWSVDHQTLVQLMFRRTGVPATRVLNTMIQAKGFGNFAVTLGSLSQRNAKGQYAVATVTPARVDETDMEAARMMMASPTAAEASDPTGPAQVKQDAVADEPAF